jgi:hypothetical protein
MPSRFIPVVEPDEVHDLFGDAFDIEPYRVAQWLPGSACFRLTRHG